MGAELAALEEEHGNEDGLFSELIEDGEICHCGGREGAAEGDQGRPVGDGGGYGVEGWLDLAEREKELKRAIKDAEAALDEAALKYSKLTEAEVKSLVVDDKWMANLERRIAGETERVSQALTRRVKELGDRYGATLPSLADRVRSWRRQWPGISRGWGTHERRAAGLQEDREWA